MGQFRKIRAGLCRLIRASAAAGLVALSAVAAGGVAGMPSSAAFAADGGVVLMYHRFGEDDLPSTSVTVEQFDAHLEELVSGPYAVMPLADLVAAVRAGRPVPDRAVAITVDDAYRSLYEVAWPKLRDAGLPFALFLSTRSIDRGAPGFMTWDQIRELHAAGVEIGSQTVTHLHMADADYTRNLDELRQSAARIADETGSRPRFVAYPYGEASAEAQQAARDAGYEAGFGQHSGVLFPQADFFYLPRYPINMTYGGQDRFRRVIETLPLAVTDLVPSDPKLADNPPDFGFTVADPGGIPVGLACYHSQFGRVEGLETLGTRRVELRFDQAFPPGRNRINCTAPGPEGRWRWFGMQYYVPGE